MAAAVEPAQLRVEPSLDEVRELAREHNVIALRNRFIDDCETPVSAFLKLRGRDRSIADAGEVLNGRRR